MRVKKFFSCNALLLFTILIFAGCNLTDSFSGEVFEADVSDQSQSSFQENFSSEERSADSNSDTFSSDADNSAVESTTQGGDADIDAILQQMTLREKVGQMFLVRPGSLGASQQGNAAAAVGATALTEPMINALQNYPVGGIIMFRENITDPQQIVDFTESLQNASKIPLFMAIDEEGGTVARLANHTAFDLPTYESAAAVGKSGDPADALSMGNTIGAYLQQYGFNMDFAPVADVNTNPNNSVIGSRAFSSDADIAAQMAAAMAQGLKQQNIIPVFKHFPGHGDTAEDSHDGIAVSYKTKEEMEKCEFLPYEKLTSEDCVMVGHISAPGITGDLTPATLSHEFVNDILRQQLSFDGPIITDSLAMGAITKKYSPGKAAIKAIEAGCDILLDPENFQEAFDAVIAAIEEGDIDEQRIDESVYRILTIKKAYGLLQ